MKLVFNKVKILIASNNGALFTLDVAEFCRTYLFNILELIENNKTILQAG